MPKSSIARLSSSFFGYLTTTTTSSVAQMDPATFLHRLTPTALEELSRDGWVLHQARLQSLNSTRQEQRTHVPMRIDATYFDTVGRRENELGIGRMGGGGGKFVPDEEEDEEKGDGKGARDEDEEGWEMLYPTEEAEEEEEGEEEVEVEVERENGNGEDALVNEYHMM